MNSLFRGLMEAAKETTKMSRVIVTEMLNPFYWSRSKKVCDFSCLCAKVAAIIIFQFGVLILPF